MISNCKKKKKKKSLYCTSFPVKLKGFFCFGLIILGYSSIEEEGLWYSSRHEKIHFCFMLWNQWMGAFRNFPVNRVDGLEYLSDLNCLNSHSY